MVRYALTLSLLGLSAVHALPTAKTVEDRQIFGIGGGGSTIGTGEGNLKPCSTTIPLEQQPPCIFAPIGGGIKPGKERRQTFGFGEGGTTIGIPGGDLKPCSTSIPLEEQPPCIFSPIGGGIKPGKARRQTFGFGEGGTTIGIPGGDLKPCSTSIPLEEQPPCIFSPIGGGIKPGKRQAEFVLPPDYKENTKKVIKELEVRLIKLQNKKTKTAKDLEEIKSLKAALKYLAGIVSISAPPGSESTFTPGKRELSFFTLDTVGAYASACPNLEAAELAYGKLLQKKKELSVEQYLVFKKLEHFLAGCGIKIIQVPEGGSVIIKPSDKKRDVVSLKPEYDLDGLLTSYTTLIQSLDGAAPSFSTWLALQHIADLLEVYGVFVDRSKATFTPLTGTTKRQIAIGTKACELGDVIGLKAALAALITAYGDPAKAPHNIFLIEQVIVTSLQICGQTVQGWTTLVPGNPIPGGPLVPEKPVPGGPIKPSDKRQTLGPIIGGPITPDKPHPGGPMVPDKPIPGGPIKPSDKRQTLGPIIGGPIVPDKPIKGGPMVPDKPIPGGPIKPSDKRQTLGPIIGGEIVPDKPIPGGPIKPSDKRQILGPIIGGPIVPDKPIPGGPIKPSDKRQVPVKDPKPLLQALELLEKQYGTYGSGKIPVPIFLIMVNMVTILQDIPGVVVPGWPVLGQGSVSIYPSP